MRALFNWKVAFALLIASGAWFAYQHFKPVADWRSGELVVILPDDPQSISAAFELELATLFAAELSVNLKPLYLPPHQVDAALQSRKAHFAARGLRKEASPALRYSNSYQTVNEQVICKEQTPRRVDELRKRSLTVVAGSPQETALSTLRQHHPELHWDARTDLPQRTLLQMVADGKLDCTAANDEQIASARNFHPELGRALDLATPSHLSWGFPATGADTLLDIAEGFFVRLRRDGTLNRLIDQHYGHNERLEPFDAAAFLELTQSVLPAFRPLFEEAEQLTGIDWQLLAALAYQESHWNPLATSYTNVRGMMMLTEDTADRMGVGNRLDARESILAGARYLQMLREQLPPRLDEQERTWLALAAYNQGMGHLEDARVLAMRSGLNPDVWTDVKKVMPLLSQEEYAAQAKHGRARGGEAVILVETVRQYHDMLKRLEPVTEKKLKKRFFGLVEKARHHLDKLRHPDSSRTAAP